MFFCRVLGSPRDPKRWSPLGCVGVGGRGGTPLFDFKNNTLVYLYFDPLLPLRHGAFHWQPGGLVPRARGRIYVAFGEHPAAGGWGLKFVVCVCVCVCPCVFVCMCLFFIGCVIGCLCLVVLVVATCGCLRGTLQGLVVSL